jgi:tRNA pseudouridine38-40 synthase
MRIKFVVAYDGTDFRGWAAQHGQRTVHGTLTDAVRQISGEEIEIQGASRTDSGAHAKGQVCHFDVSVPIPPERWPNAVNRILPGDLKVVSSQKVQPQFHSRFMAVDRHYRYRIAVGKPDPHRNRFVHEYGRPVDLSLMRRAANLLLGEHDFRAFTEELDSGVENTVRRIFRFEVNLVRDEVWVDVVGTAFLRGMMRRMVGAVLEVGRLHRPIVEVSQLLDTEQRNNVQWPVVLPAKGLCLMRVRYGRHPLDSRLQNDFKANPQG